MKIIILLLLLFPSFLSAQELNATVTVNFEQLSNGYKDRLVNFAQEVQNYLNSNKYTGNNWQGNKIKCNFDIFFTSANQGTQYSAQVVVTSQRDVYRSADRSLMLRIQDPTWSFNYVKGQSMYFNQTAFDPLLSFLDYYAYLIIGLDMDSYGPLAGTPMFNKAMQITILGANGKYSKGWQVQSSNYNKSVLVENLTDARYQQFRKDFFNYHYNGIDLFKSNKKLAQKNIAKLIKDVYNMRNKIDPTSVLLKVFFDAKAKEIVKYLKGYPDKSIFKMLKIINPSHTAIYNKALGEKSLVN